MKSRRQLGEEPANPINRILVPVDGSPASGNAAEYTAKMVRLSGASVTLLFASDMQSLRDAPLSADMRAELIKAMEDAHREMLAPFARMFMFEQIPIEIRLVEGAPATVIAQAAEEGAFDLIVMGSAGLGLADEQHIQIGSVTERVLRRVRCPVLVIK